MNIPELLSLLKSKISDPELLRAALQLVLELATGQSEIDPDTRLTLQAEIDALIGGRTP